MQVIGIGTDIIEVDRIENALDDRFKEKYLTDNEIENLSAKSANSLTYAGRFAAKEAIVKAFGTGFGMISAKDIEIMNDELGAPNAKIIKDGFEAYDIKISISHIKSVATAMALITKGE